MAQSDQVSIQIPKSRWNEGSAFIATAYFRLRSTAAAATPTNVRYRIDNLSTRTELAGWTTVSAASNISIAITATHNAIQNNASKTERLQLTVAADHDLATQHRETKEWTITNLYGMT